MCLAWSNAVGNHHSCCCILASCPEPCTLPSHQHWLQGFKWAVDQDRWHDRVATIRAVFDAAATDLGAPAVDLRVVRAVWDRLLPGTSGMRIMLCLL